MSIAPEPITLALDDITTTVTGFFFNLYASRIIVIMPLAVYENGKIAITRGSVISERESRRALYGTCYKKKRKKKRKERKIYIRTTSSMYKSLGEMVIHGLRDTWYNVMVHIRR